MAKLIASESLGQAWVAAARHLAGCKKHKDRNLILEISTPQQFRKDDLKIIKAMDEVLRRSRKDLRVETVASTIFPNELARRFSRPKLYTNYLVLLTVRGTSTEIAVVGSQS